MHTYLSSHCVPSGLTFSCRVKLKCKIILDINNARINLLLKFNNVTLSVPIQ